MNRSEVKQSETETVCLPIPTHPRGFQADALEPVAFEVRRQVRSMKNSSAPISRIPPELLSLIPDYYCEGDLYQDHHDVSIRVKKDRDLITFTHVCRSWRDTFISRSSLWTRLSFWSVEKTLAYIQRSQSSPLKIDVIQGYAYRFDTDFPLVIPHIHRLKSLTICARWLPSGVARFRCHIPLEELIINMSAKYNDDPVLDGALFNGGLSSLRELRLGGVITNLPWKNMTNLRILNLRCRDYNYKIIQILNFLESAPLLHTVKLDDWVLPSFDDAPPEQIVHLRHLKVFSIEPYQPPSILLRHLHIPIGASLILAFHFSGQESPFADYLPERSTNFENLSHITTITLAFHRSVKMSVRLSGPRGSLRARVLWNGDFPSDKHHRIIHSLGRPMLSTIQKLTFLVKFGIEISLAFQTLSFTGSLRTLVCSAGRRTMSFIEILDPRQNPSNLLLCVNLEELVFHVEDMSEYNLSVELLVGMAKNRASREAKLSSITIVSSVGPVLEDIFKLREHVTHVVCRVEQRKSSAWDDIPGESCEGGE